MSPKKWIRPLQKAGQMGTGLELTLEEDPSNLLLFPHFCDVCTLSSTRDVQPSNSLLSSASRSYFLLATKLCSAPRDHFQVLHALKKEWAEEARRRSEGQIVMMALHPALTCALHLRGFLQQLRDGELNIRRTFYVSWVVLEHSVTRGQNLI